MNIVIILYLAVISIFSAGYLYRGFKAIISKKGSPEELKIIKRLGAHESDRIDFAKQKTLHGTTALVSGILVLLIMAITFIAVPDLTGIPEPKNIHLIRTLVIALTVIYFTGDLVTTSLREKYITRAASEAAGINIRHAIISTVLWATLIYSVYTQLTFQW